jgi:hypothetical protein
MEKQLAYGRLYPAYQLHAVPGQQRMQVIAALLGDRRRPEILGAVYELHGTPSKGIGVARRDDGPPVVCSPIAACCFGHGQTRREDILQAGRV